MPTPSARRAAALAAVAVLALAGCSSGKTRTAPEPRPTPIAQLNTASMQLPRIDFCRLVPAAAVRDALGAKPASDAAYGNGDSDPASGVSGQVLQEVGCTWTGADGSVARAWVFARPVDAGFAQRTMQATGRQRGCRLVPGPGFGAPALTQQCTLPNASGAVARVRHAGLFGQTWLSCEVAGAPGQPLTAVAPRADAWCVEVAEALNTRR